VIDVDALMEQANPLIVARRLSEAKELYLDAIKAAPDYADAWLMLGLVEQELANLSTAEKHLRHAIELDPQFAEALLNLANLLLLQARPDEARNCARQAVHADEKYTEAWVFLGQVELTCNNYSSAESCFNQAVSLGAVSADNYFMLAKANIQVGHLAAAVQNLKIALECEPTRADISHTLANSLITEGSAAEALPILNSLITSLPTGLAEAEVFFSLGGAHYALKDYALARDWYDKACSANPHAVRSRICLARAESQLRHYDCVIEQCRLVLNSEPGHFKASLLLAIALRQTGDFSGAMQMYLDLLKSHPERHDIIGGLMEIYERTGNFDKARALWAQVSSTPFCEMPNICYVAAAILKRDKKYDEAISLLEELLKCTDWQKNNFPDRVLPSVHNRLGQLLDRKACYDEAFTHYSAANDFCVSTFSEARHIQIIDQIINGWNRFTQPIQRVLPRSGPHPLFLIGMPRSGTTLAEQILASHPWVSAGGEIQAVPQMAAQISADNENLPFVSPACADISRIQLEKAIETYLEILNDIDPQARYVSDKQIYNYPHLGLISSMFPDAKIIHCKRNPMDTCLSLYMQNFSGPRGFATKLDYIGVVYGQYMRLMAHWRNVIPNPVFELSYEAMVDNQEETTRSLLEFCGLPWDERCLDFHQNERIALTASYDQIRQPMYRDSMGRWHHYRAHLTNLMHKLKIAQVTWE
jgi:tetratricopeptide (TPR) repeat protein